MYAEIKFPFVTAMQKGCRVKSQHYPDLRYCAV
jgi:hypothetical protein